MIESRAREGHAKAGTGHPSGRPHRLVDAPHGGDRRSRVGGAGPARAAEGLGVGRDRRGQPKAWAVGRTGLGRGLRGGPGPRPARSARSAESRLARTARCGRRGRLGDGLVWTAGAACATGPVRQRGRLSDGLARTAGAACATGPVRQRGRLSDGLARTAGSGRRGRRLAWTAGGVWTNDGLAWAAGRALRTRPADRQTRTTGSGPHEGDRTTGSREATPCGLRGRSARRVTDDARRPDDGPARSVSRRGCRPVRR